MTTSNELKIRSVTDDPQEVRIKVPWGYIAGKWWGPKHVRPILCLHGWQDNAGTFDRIIPLLPKHVGYLAIDFPGHGLSSRVPDGMFYNNFESIPLLKYIKKIYKWDKISILAHSMGAVISYVYVGFYPDDVDMYIAIDSLKVIVRETTEYIESMPDQINSFLLADERNRNNSEPPSYPYEICVEKLIEGTYNSIDRDSAPYLLNRNISKSESHPDHYYFTRDNRLKSILFTQTTHEMNMELAKRIKCGHMHIRAKGSRIVGSKEEYFEVVDYLQKNNPKFEYHVVDGTHHVHLTAPEVVKGIMSDFINKYRPAAIQAPNSNSKL